MNRYVKEALYGALGGIAGTFVLGTLRSAIQNVQTPEDAPSSAEDPATKWCLGATIGQRNESPYLCGLRTSMRSLISIVIRSSLSSSGPA